MFSLREPLGELLSDVSTDEIFSCPNLEPRHFIKLMDEEIITVEKYRERREEEDVVRIQGFMKDLERELPNIVGKDVLYELRIEADDHDSLTIQLKREGLFTRAADLEEEKEIQEVVDILKKHFIKEKILDEKVVNKVLHDPTKEKVFAFFKRVEQEIPFVACDYFTLTIDGNKVADFEYGEKF